MYVKRYLDTDIHSYEECLDTRFWTWENLSVDDIVWRCQLMLDSISWYDWILLPPICEILYYEWKLKTNTKVVPLFSTYCMEVMNNSTVWKVACFIPLQSQWILMRYWKSLVDLYVPSQYQISNKYFQTHFPLYSVDTQFRNVCFDLKKSWFVNKLLKIQCRKLKDYNVDSLMITNWWYMYALPVITKVFPKKIKYLTQSALKILLQQLLP